MKTSSSAPKLNFFQREKKSWFGNIVGDLWGGAVTTFALLPEVIGFMIVVGVQLIPIKLKTCIMYSVSGTFLPTWYSAEKI